MLSYIYKKSNKYVKIIEFEWYTGKQELGENGSTFYYI